MGGVAEYPVLNNTTLVIRDANISGYSARAWKLSGGVLGGRGVGGILVGFVAGTRRRGDARWGTSLVMKEDPSV